MCGIAGYVATQAVEPSAKIISRMTAAIAHRGPDDQGFFTDSHASLGHRRLSIIDLTTGHQPMYNEDGSLVIIYNGEIFNHASLRPSLEQAGHRYSSHCDTETILHAYEQHGEDCVNLFRGMFAFVIWDRGARKLFCVRDRLGIKPFYYFFNGQVFVFGSEIKAILEHPAVSPELNESVVPEILSFGYSSSDRTLFRHIRKLMPGHHLTLDLAASRPEPRIRQYWDVPVPEASPARDDESWIAEFRQRLEETVRTRLMSDVPLGMFLSGGVDSSAIAAIMKRITGDQPVKTFSVGYSETQYSELGYADQVARAIGTDHHTVTVGMEEFFRTLPEVIWHEDEPVAWPSSVSLYFVSRLAAQQVKVVLTGEGSDELFAGYERYGHYLWNSRWMSRYRAVPGLLRTLIRNQIATNALLSGDLRRKARHTFLGREDSVESLHLDNFYCAFSQRELHQLLGTGEMDIYGGFLQYWNARRNSAVLPRLQYADQKTYLVELLMKQDQMSMAASIESRVPFLDHTFVEFSTRIPGHLRIRDGERKYILKRAVEDLLPRDIVYRKKMGFPTPVRDWFRSPGAEYMFSLLSAPDGLLTSLIDLPVMRRLLDEHRAGRQDGTDRIWRLLNLQIWGDMFLTGKQERWEGMTARATSA